jgi:hypothetical protein
MINSELLYCNELIKWSSIFIKKIIVRKQIENKTIEARAMKHLLTVGTYESYFIFKISVETINMCKWKISSLSSTLFQPVLPLQYEPHIAKLINR